MAHPVKTPSQSIRQIIHDGLVSGSIASIASSISLSILGKAELGDSAAPMNGPSQWLWGRHAPYQNRFTLRYTIVGYVIHHAASVFWAIWYERLRRRFAPARTVTAVLAPAVIATAAAYTVDFHFTPKRLTPGFEHRLSKPSLLIVYGTFALGLAAAALVGRPASPRRSRKRRPASGAERRLPE